MITNNNPLITELGDEQIFVCYTKDKVPIDPNTGYGAKANDKSTWSDFKTAELFANTNSNIAGVGVELGKLSNGKILCAIDIDDCINSQGKISSTALKIIKEMNSYTEYSLSNRGIHIFYLSNDDVENNNFRKNISKGYKDDNDENNWCSHFEHYNGKRYIALTGKDFTYDFN